MLELAALAAGYEGTVTEYANGYAEMALSNHFNPSGSNVWRPNSDDGDSFRLEVALYLVVEVLKGSTVVSMSLNAPNYLDCCATVEHDGDPLAATRLAVLQVAAEIGKSMRSKGGAA